MSESVPAGTTEELAISGGSGASIAAWRWLGSAALIALAIVLPFTLSNYHVFQLTQVMIYAIAVLGLNILTGYNGQISLGHGGFFAAGAYTAAILMHRYGVPYWATLPPAALMCFALGVLFGLPALRFEGPYLALVTLAMAVAMPQLLKYFDTWTGGAEKDVPMRLINRDRINYERLSGDQFDFNPGLGLHRGHRILGRSGQGKLRLLFIEKKIPGHQVVDGGDD